MRLCVVAFALVACKSAPPGPAAAPPGSAPPGVTTSAHDPWAGSAGAERADAGAPPRADSTVTIYERGTFTTMPTSKATERAGCIGTPEALAACKQLRPDAHCDLAPWYRAADVYCSGTPVEPTPPGPAEACGCTCSDEYIKAYGEWSQRAQACKNVP